MYSNNDVQKVFKNLALFFLLLSDTSYIFCSDSIVHTNMCLYVSTGVKNSKHWWLQIQHTAKTKCRKLETNIPRKGISVSQSQSPHSCFCERIIYSHDGSAFTAGGNMYVDRSWESINRSQTHECGNWGWGRAIPRKGIYNRNCRCSADSSNTV